MTQEMFRALCTFYRFHPSLIDLVIGMGFKSSSEDEHFASSYSRIRSIKLDDDATENLVLGRALDIPFLQDRTLLTSGAQRPVLQSSLF